MALGNKKQERIFSESSGNADSITAEELAHIKSKFDTNDYLLDQVSFETLAPVLYQLQQMSLELDEIRRYILSAEALVALSGSNLPTSATRSGSGLLWNDRGTVKVG